MKLLDYFFSSLDELATIENEFSLDIWRFISESEEILIYEKKKQKWAY